MLLFDDNGSEENYNDNDNYDGDDSDDKDGNVEDEFM